jgi:hypothetical protein
VRPPDPPPEPSVRARTSLELLDAARLQERFAGLGLTHIADAPDRRPVRLVGEIRSHRSSSYEDAPSLAVVIDDGTGTAMAVFSGRRRIRGLDSGRTVVVEGVGRREPQHFVIHNPAYTLLA